MKGIISGSGNIFFISINGWVDEELLLGNKRLAKVNKVLKSKLKRPVQLSRQRKIVFSDHLVFQIDSDRFN